MMLRILLFLGLLTCIRVASAETILLAQIDSLSGGYLTPDQAAQGIVGRILGMQAIVENGRTLYVYKVLTPDGRIHYIKIDSVTGQRW